MQIWTPPACTFWISARPLTWKDRTLVPNSGTRFTCLTRVCVTNLNTGTTRQRVDHQNAGKYSRSRFVLVLQSVYFLDIGKTVDLEGSHTGPNSGTRFTCLTRVCVTNLNTSTTRQRVNHQCRKILSLARRACIAKTLVRWIPSTLHGYVYCKTPPIWWRLFAIALRENRPQLAESFITAMEFSSTTGEVGKSKSLFRRYSWPGKSLNVDASSLDIG